MILALLSPNQPVRAAPCKEEPVSLSFAQTPANLRPTGSLVKALRHLPHSPRDSRLSTSRRLYPIIKVKSPKPQSPQEPVNQTHFSFIFFIIRLFTVSHYHPVLGSLYPLLLSLLFVLFPSSSSSLLSLFSFSLFDECSLNLFFSSFLSFLRSI